MHQYYVKRINYSRGQGKQYIFAIAFTNLKERRKKAYIMLINETVNLSVILVDSL